MASSILFAFVFCVGSFNSAIARPSWKGSGYFITRPEINLCTLRVNNEDITSYKEFVVGRGWIVRPCAPGTSYDPKTCACSNFFPKEQKDAISGPVTSHSTFTSIDIPKVYIIFGNICYRPPECINSTFTCYHAFYKSINDKFSENDKKETHTVTETGTRSEDDTETGISYGTVYGSYKHSSEDDYRPVSSDELDTSNSMESNKDAYNTRSYSKDGPDAREDSEDAYDTRPASCKSGPDRREYSKNAYDTRVNDKDGPDGRRYSENAYDMRNNLNKSTNHNTDKHKRLENKDENNLMNKLLKLVFQNTSKDEIEEVGAIIEELLLKHLDAKI